MNHAEISTMAANAIAIVRAIEPQLDDLAAIRSRVVEGLMTAPPGDLDLNAFALALERATRDQRRFQALLEAAQPMLYYCLADRHASASLSAAAAPCPLSAERSTMEEPSCQPV